MKPSEFYRTLNEQIEDDKNTGTKRDSMKVFQKGTGEALIFIHGIVGNHRAFKNHLDSFSADYHVIAYDILGHGDDRGEWVPFSIKDLVDELLTVYRETGIQRAHLCSLSYGSYIANAFASEYPEKVLSLCHIGGYYNNPSRLLDTFIELWETRDEEFYEWVKRISILLNPNTNTMPNPFAEESQTIWYKYGIQIHSSILKEWIEQCVFFDIKSRLHQIVHPVLWIMGEYDYLYKTSLYDLKDIIPQVEYIEIPDAGHVAHIFQPQHFEKAYRRFLQTKKVVYL
jgi:pimeloyl-ACP methyl ester carboxylesterase